MSRTSLLAAFLLLLGYQSASIAVQQGDLDGDGDIDRLDLELLLARRGSPALGPEDPADLDRDGLITVIDSRKLVLLCSRPRCEVVYPDRTAPMVTPPDDLTLFSSSDEGLSADDPRIQSFLQSATAQDDQDGLLVPVHDAPAVFPLGATMVQFTATDAAGNRGSASATVAVVMVGTPDPRDVAPSLDDTITTTLGSATSFLYSGANPIQQGVVPGTISPVRAAVLRGRALSSDETPLSGVEITIKDHPEYGATETRSDGAFDIAVNGGGFLTVAFEKTAFTSAMRIVSVPWQEYVNVPDVILLQRDPVATRIDFAIGAAAQVARGSVRIDEDGPRQATLVFPEGGNMVHLLLPDGTVLPAISSLNIRLTEATVGENGPAAMPLELPPTSAYTYAVELSADEAVQAGADEVRFSKPVSFYVENFLDFPVGLPVPVGSLSGRKYVDQCGVASSRNAWVPEENGRIIGIVSETAGLANVDINGDGIADTGAALAALGITDAERSRLAALYQPGASLWRARVTHFSWIDLNFPERLPPDVPPGPPCPDCDPPEPDDPPPDDECEEEGSILGCQSQSLEESIAIVGTPFRLHYRSDATPGRRAASSLRIPLTGPAVPASLKRIDLKVSIAGREFVESFPGSPDAATTFRWDGRDAYGRLVHGAQPVSVQVEYVYPFAYAVPAASSRSFGLSCFGDAARPGFAACVIPGTVKSQARQETSLIRSWQGFLGGIPPEATPRDQARQGPGGWTFDVHHRYDVNARVLHRGDGSRVSAGREGPIIRTIAGGGTSTGDGVPATDASFGLLRAIAAGPDGTLYVSDNGLVRRVLVDGTITTFAGNPAVTSFVDCVPATQSQRIGSRALEVAPDGSVYSVDQNHVIRVGPDGIVREVIPPEIEPFSSMIDVAAAPDGSLYVTDLALHKIRRVGPDGTIQTVAGTGTPGFSGDGGPAARAQLRSPWGIAMGVDGSLYLTDRDNHRIRRVGPDGVINTVAGNGFAGFSGDGGPAKSARLNRPRDIAIDRDGSIYFTEDASPTRSDRVRRIGPDGIIQTVAGNGTSAFGGDGGPATAAQLWGPNALALPPSGGLYISDGLNRRVRSLRSVFDGFSSSNIHITSSAGNEVYLFDESGRHLETVDALSGTERYEFGYDQRGQLVTITDGAGNVTTIERAADGGPTAIVASSGQRTTLTLDANGYLASITNPAGDAFEFTYSADGLLVLETDPAGSTHRYAYDAEGRLLTDEDPAGGFQDLVREVLDGGYQVVRTTATGASTTYSVRETSLDFEERSNTFPGGDVTRLTTSRDGTRELRLPDATTIQLRAMPDPRFGMQAALPGQLTVSTPLGLARVSTLQSTATLANPADPFSLQTLTEVLTVNGRRFTRAYDALQRLSTSTSPEGRSSQIRLDARGHVVQSRRAGLTPLLVEYDASGRPARFAGGDRFLATVFDASGELSSLTDSLSRTTTFDRDLAGRILGVTRPDGSVIEYSYDANGNRLSVTPPGRPSHQFTYTPHGKLQDYAAPDLGDGALPLSYSYDADRRLQRVTLPDGRVIDRDYDPAGRLQSIAHPRGTIQYGYGSGGRLTRIIAPGDVRFDVERDGHLITGRSWTGPVQGTVRDAYNSSFQVISRQIGEQPAIPFLYDRDGRIVQAGDLAIQRDPQHGLAVGTSLGGIQTASTYNGFAELETFTTTFGGMILYGAAYSYDVAGRIVRITEEIQGTAAVREYRYDPLGRLAEVHADDLLTTAYTYDQNGNRLGRTGGPLVENGDYDAQDRLRSFGDLSLQYGPSGQLAHRTVGSTGERTSYEYDALGNLASVVLPDGRAIEYLVDGLGRRVGKRMAGALARGYLYQDRLKPAAELDATGAVSSQFVFATHRSVPDYLIRNGRAYRIVVDHLGSPRLIVDSVLGTVVQRLDYDEFGRVLLDTNPGFQPFGYAGGLYDGDTGLVRFGARDYDSEVGRFTAKDPALFAGDTNLYAYVRNDPLNRRDDFGLDDDPGLTQETPVTVYDSCADDPACVVLPEDETYGPQDAYEACISYDPSTGPPPDVMDKLICGQLTGFENEELKEQQRRLDEQRTRLLEFEELFGMTIEEACSNGPPPNN